MASWWYHSRLNGRASLIRLTPHDLDLILFTDADGQFDVSHFKSTNVSHQENAARIAAELDSV